MRGEGVGGVGGLVMDIGANFGQSSPFPRATVDIREQSTRVEKMNAQFGEYSSNSNKIVQSQVPQVLILPSLHQGERYLNAGFKAGLSFKRKLE